MRMRSLQGQLAVRLAAVFLVATILGVGALFYKGTQAAAVIGTAGEPGGDLSKT